MRPTLRLLAAIVFGGGCNSFLESSDAGTGTGTEDASDSGSGSESTGGVTSAASTSAASSTGGVVSTSGVDATGSDGSPEGSSSSGGADPVRCDWLEQPDGAREVGLCAPARTWQEAEDACVSVGGHLVSFTSATENLFAINVLTGTNEAWIGLSDLERRGTYTWTDGSPYRYLNWDDTQPDAARDNCTVIGVSQRWFDYACDLERPFLCARPL